LIRPRIAIPMPHGVDLEYAGRAIPQYERSVEMAGGQPVRIALDLPETAVREAAQQCDGVLLPGSKADLDPARFHVPRSPHTAETDGRREAVDNLLLDEAYRSHKPVLGICYGLQSLNVYRGGSLVQHIPDFLPEITRNKVNHEAGRAVPVAHKVEIDPGSLLGKLLGGAESNVPGNNLVLAVNSSHHQSAEKIGEGLRVTARCPDDAIIEALEGTEPDHFVLAVQWHPERSVEQDEASRKIFKAFVTAATGE